MYQSHKYSSKSKLSNALIYTKAPLQRIYLDNVKEEEMAEALYQLCTRENSTLLSLTIERPEEVSRLGSDFYKINRKVIMGLALSKTIENIQLRSLNHRREIVLTDGSVEFEDVFDEELYHFLAENIPKNPSLTSLTYSMDMKITIPQEMLNIPPLKTLYISGTQLYDLQFLSNLPNLEHLSGYMELTTEGISNLSHCISNPNSKLHTLFVEKLELKDPNSISLLGQALANNNVLEVLNLRKSNISGNDFYDYIGQAFGNPSCALTRITLSEMTLAATPQQTTLIFKNLINNTKLEYFLLVGDLNDEGIEALIQFVTANKTFKHLNISSKEKKKNIEP